MANVSLMSDNPNAKKHIVFIHGLGGNSLSTWQSGSSDKVFWPNWLGEGEAGTNVWSVDYEAPKSSFLNTGMGLEDRAQNIYERLLTEKTLSGGELILVGHSFGGLIIKQMLRLASDEPERPEAVEFVNRVTGVCFLGTPHAGAELAKKGNNFLAKLCSLPLLLFSSAATASLTRNDPKLRELNNWYRAWCRNKNIRHLTLMENKRTYVFFMIVEPGSADPGLKESAILVDKNHIDISKPSSKDDEVYKHILQFVSKDTLSNQELWLRAKFGLNTTGWKGYENWASCPNGIEEEYILDQDIRLHDYSSNKNESLVSLDALNELRQRLRDPKTSLRLVGLSGVGKTRFVQALFDERIGVCALPQELVFYTDMSFSPTPSPRILLEKLLFDAMTFIVIVDNCLPDLHGNLTKLLHKQNGSTVSLLTVEYDVREDQPEETDVFFLEPSSSKLIEKMLEARFEFLSQQDVRTIAEFSGGNARIANALASTIGRGQSISRLNNEELFTRLFWQHHKKDRPLKKAAEALALVYSFQIEGKDGYSADITLLSQLLHLSPQELYESSQELKRRQLAQQRGIWMAVLPHPIANKLACFALQNIPSTQISSLLNYDSDTRILKSFSRRLGYLNDSEEARALASSWLLEEGMVDLLCANKKDALAYTLLSNIAPVIPKDTLHYLKRQADRDSTNTFLTRNNKNHTTITRLLRSLAYGKDLFTESVALLCLFAINESEGENNNSIRDLLRSLFQLYLSGTHAGIEQRLCVIKELTASACSARQNIGLELLEATLKANRFSSSHGFDFGANSRNYGYVPRSTEEIEKWYTTFIDFCVSLIKSNPQLGERAKDILANRFRGLWKHSGLHNLLEGVFYELNSAGSWVRGWRAVGTALKYNSNSMSEEAKQHLINMQKRLSPTSCGELMQAYVLSKEQTFFELDEEENIIKHGSEKAAEMAENLGSQIISEQFAYFQEILPSVFVAESGQRGVYNFGKGCANGTSDPAVVWALIVKCIEKLGITKINTGFLEGYVNRLNERDYAQAQILLNSLLEDDTLNYIFPLVQFACPLDANAVHRIKQALINKSSPTGMYRFIARQHETIADSELISILDLLWQQSEGQWIALEILQMRFCEQEINEAYRPSDELIDKGRKFLLGFNYNKESRNIEGIDYSLSEVASVCFSAESACGDARNLFKKLIDTIPSGIGAEYNLEKLLTTMVKKYPLIALDTFFGADGSLPYQIKNAFMRRLSGKPSPFSGLPLEMTLSWCEEKPQQRFNALASLITPYEKIEKSYQWTPLAITLLEKSPGPNLILHNYIQSFAPMTCWGSMASALEQRTPLLQSLTEHPDAVISQCAKEQMEKWNKDVATERKNEEDESRRTDERFE